MLEMIMEKNVIYVVTAGAALVGVISKCIANVSLKRMMHAAGNMSKSNHSLMRLVRAKFEHACLVSDKVENVRVFVDKYLLEYKALGVRLHSWQKLEKTAAVWCAVLGLLGAWGKYSLSGMSDEVLKLGAYGGILGIFTYLFHLTTDEKYRMDVTRNYMVDYLENVCLHRHEKAMQKEKEEAVCKEPEIEIPAPVVVPEPEPPMKPEPLEIPAPKEQVKSAEKKPDKDVLIRQILEEFMA